MPRLPHPRTALSDLADDRLGRLRGWWVRRHLRCCTRCELEVAQIRSLRRLLAAPKPPPLPPGLLSRLLDIGGAEPSASRQVPPGHAVPAVPPDVPSAVPDVPAVPPARRHRGSVGAAGVLVAGVVLVGAAGTGAVLTSPPGAWQGPGARASLTSVLPRLLPREDEPAGAVSERPVDNGSRP